jgi:hypothetical protein
MDATMLSKSIAELEKVDWPKPRPDTPPIFVRCYELRKKRISTLNVQDLRVLIGQDVGLEYVLSMGLDEVERDPLVEAEHYKGDLLAVILRASSGFYELHPDLRSRAEQVLAKVPTALEKLDFVDFDASSEALEEAASEFREGGPR